MPSVWLHYWQQQQLLCYLHHIFYMAAKLHEWKIPLEAFWVPCLYMISCMILSLCPNHILIFSQNLEAHDYVSSLLFLCYIIVKGRVFILLGWSWLCGSLNLPMIQLQIWWPTRGISGFSYSNVCFLQITTQTRSGLLIPLTMLTLSYLQLLILFSKPRIYCYTPLASESVGLWMNHFFQLCEILSDIVSDRGPQFSSHVW